MHHTIIIILSAFLTLPLLNNLFAGELELILGDPNTEKFPEVCMTIFVKDSSGSEVTSLDSSMVTVHEDTVQNFSVQMETIGERDERVAILIAVDASRSMAGEPIDSIKAAIKQVLDEINMDDQVAIISFHDDVEIISEFSSDKDSLRAKTDMIKATGEGTELYYGIHEGLELLNEDDGLSANKVLIVLSDGKDEGTAYSDDEAIDKAREFNIPIYTIGYHTKSEKKYLRVLERISEKTGGRYNDAPTTKELSRIYSQVLAQIRQQNKLCFVAQLFGADSLEHTITVSVTTVAGASGNASVTFRSPARVATTMEFNWIIIIVVVLVLIAVSVGINNANKKKAIEERELLEDEKSQLERELEEEKRARQQAESVTEEPAPAVEQEPDPRHTIISSGGTGEGYQLQFHFESGPLAGQTKMVSTGMSIGRAGDNDLAIPESTVSGNHCRIDYKGDQYVITDLNSTNGTIVNGNKVSACAIKQGDRIKLGKVNIVVK